MVVVKVGWATPPRQGWTTPVVKDGPHPKEDSGSGTVTTGSGRTTSALLEGF
jgi:hypothetical protein